MLKTALKPRWIAALVFALVISWVFVLLSQWQFSRSVQSDAPPPVAIQTTQPLTKFMQPGVAMLGSQQDQLVTATGHFDPTKQVVVQQRLQDGKLGYWVATAFVVDGAPKVKGAAGTAETIIPVARGWIAQPSQAGAPPSGTVHLMGRLIAPEAPISDPNGPAGQVTALSTAQLVNVWQTSTYSGFIISNSETVNGAGVGAQSVTGDLKAITVTDKNQDGGPDLLNIFYAIEWVVFAGFAVFLWWRLVADDYRRENGLDDDSEYMDDPTEGAPDVPAAKN